MDAATWAAGRNKRMSPAARYRQLRESGSLTVAACLSRSWSVDDSIAGNRIASPGATLLSLVSIACASLGVWRVGSDLGWAGDFVVHDGFLSHWQVWVGAAAGLQYASLLLARYARNNPVMSAEPVPDRLGAAMLEPDHESAAD
jgi:hypothetical protein